MNFGLFGVAIISFGSVVYSCLILNDPVRGFVSGAVIGVVGVALLSMTKTVGRR